MIRSILRKLDIFPRTINFTINGIPKFKTSVGGALTILMIILFIFVILNLSYDYIHKLNPALFSQTIIEVDDHFINMNNPFTNIILQPFRKDIVNEFRIPSSLFYIKAENASYIKYTDGRPKENTFNELGVKRCNISDFHESLHENYKINNFDQSFCVNKQNTIQGAYTSDIFKFVRVGVTSCAGKDSITGEKIICMNRTEVLKEIGNWKISVFLTYAIPNPSNYTQAFQTQIFNKAYVFYPAISMRENYFLSKDIVSTDDDLFPTGSVYNMTLPNYFGQDTAVTYNNLDSGTDEWAFFSLFFRTHTSYTLLKRTYKKLPEILAGTISFIDIFYIILTFVYPFYNVIPLNLDIINSTFHQATNDEIMLRQEIKKIIESISNNVELNKNDNTFFKPARGVNHSEMQPITHNINGMLYLKKKTKYEKFKDNNKLNKINTASLICYKLTCRKNKKTIVYNHFNQTINNKLDFKKYLGIYEDLERIKDLILDDSQKIVFDHWLRNYSFDSENKINSNWLQERFISNQEIISAVTCVSNSKAKTNIHYSLLNSLDIK